MYKFTYTCKKQHVKNKPEVEGVASSVVQYLSSMLKTLQHKGKKKKEKEKKERKQTNQVL